MASMGGGGGSERLLAPPPGADPERRGSSPLARARYDAPLRV
jgi:hypothetical protein